MANTCILTLVTFGAMISIMIINNLGRKDLFSFTSTGHSSSLWKSRQIFKQKLWTVLRGLLLAWDQLLFLYNTELPDPRCHHSHINQRSRQIPRTFSCKPISSGQCLN